MTKVEQIVSRALEQHVVLYVKEGRLAYTASGSGMPDDLRAEIAASKVDIVEYLKDLEPQADSGGLRMQHAPQGVALPLAVQQEQIWLAQNIGDDGQYNITNAFAYHGALDEGRMRHALRKVLERHDILRTVYVADGDRVALGVLDASGFDIVIRDVAGMDGLQALVATDQCQAFDLATDYPIRVICYRRSADDWVVSITIHHIASDGRSQELLVSEIAGAYKSPGESEEPALDPLPYSYGDYAWSQRQALATGRMDREKATWAMRLGGIATTALLPTDFARPKVFVGRGGAVECRFDAGETAHIVALARKRNLTLFMLLESMLALLIGRWSKSTDVVIGSPVAGRDDDGLQDVIGLFVNVLPLRTSCPERGSLASFLQDNKAVQLEAFATKSLPLPIMLESLGIEPARSHSPLFQTVFNLQPAMESGFGLGGVPMSPLPQPPLIKYDLEVVALQGRDELSLSWKYADTLFAETTIETLAATYRGLLLQASVDDDIDVASLSFVELDAIRRTAADADTVATVDGAEDVMAIIRASFPGYLVACTRHGSEKTFRRVAYVLPMDAAVKDGFAACRERAIAGIVDSLGESRVPDAWQLIGSECLDAHGRIDRKTLPRVVFSLRSETERQVAAVWADLLECGEVGLTDDFFDLGGNSIKAMRVTSKVAEVCHAQMQIRDLFEHTVFADYAAQVEERLSGGSAAIAKRAEGDRMTLSFAQERLWFLDQLNGGSPEYNMPALFQIDGRFDTAVAEQAMALIIERHEVLRTTYVDDGLGPVQYVSAAGGFRIDHVDLSALPTAAAEAELSRLIVGEISRPFDLAAGPMVRAGYYQLGDSAECEHRGILYFNIHHIACDGWSLDLLVNEFVTAYRGMADAVRPALPVLPIQYGDYAHSQRQWLGSPSFDRQLTYWMAQLDGVPAVHSLRLDTPRPPMKGYDGECVTGRIDRMASDAFESLARRFQLTPFMLMHAALALVLARHGNADDVVVGTPVANRHQAQTEDLIGFFVSTLVLRVQAGHEGLEDYLRHVRQVHLDAQSNQDVPFELLVERLGMPRTTQHTPLFQIMLTSDADYGLKRGDDERALLTLPGAVIRNYAFEGFTAKFDLEINISATRDGMRLRWTYDSGIFARASIERLNNHLERVMTSLAAMAHAETAPAFRLRDLPMLSPIELDFLLNAETPAVPWPKDRCIHQLFVAQAFRTPDAIALECDGERISYGQLAALSSSMATFLRQTHGVGPGHQVGVCLERNADMVVAVLGILQAGAAYVPLDPAYPIARLAHIVSDARISVVLADAGTVTRVDGLQCRRVLIDEHVFAADADAVTFDADAAPDDLAYVIYTSGSTGMPKGVAIRHANAVSMLHWAVSAYTDDELERVLASTSLSFDLSVFELFVPLCFGHCCVLVRDALALVERPVDVTLINTVPSAIKVLLESNAVPLRTRTVNLAGEPLPRQVVNDLLSRSACLSVCNLYGPSEDTTYSTAARFDAPLDDAVPIGRVIANSQGLILSPTLALLPPGVVGELYLSGAGVAKGYFGNDALTATRFLPNPYHDSRNPHSGPVLYRTGDLVRYDTSGQLHFVGRSDSQVKVRGFRIELSEIEQQMCRHAWVDSAIVVVRGPVDGSRELVAYVRPADTFTEGADSSLAFALREDLALVLPGYMVPSAIVLVDAWPLSPNGKIDRAALPAPGEQGAGVPVREPSGELEVRLLDIWEGLLARTGFGVDTDFFSLGGNSLLLTRLHSRIKAECGVSVPVRTLFGHRSIAAQALIIDGFQTMRNAEEALTADVTEEEL